ncbi:hypothetical protein BD779DRAFT_1464554, partial [Infundibulicybe gibba]
DIEDVEVDEGPSRHIEDMEVDDDGDEEEVQANEDGSDLEESQCSHIPTLLPVKADSSRNIWLMFTQKVTVRFTTPQGLSTTCVGSWCKTCKADTKFVAESGLRKCLHLGGNSSLRAHIRSRHWDLYESLCKENGISPNKICMPTKISKVLDKAKQKQKQTKLDQVFAKMEGPHTMEFSCQNVLRSVAQFVACDNQVCSRASG